MIITPWDIAIIITKLLNYVGVVGFVGGMFMYFTMNDEFSRDYIKSHCQLLLMAGGIATIVNFFIQVGVFAEAGLAGMFEPLFLSLLWQSSVGDALISRIVAFVIGLVTLILWAKSTKKQGYIVIMWLIGLVLLGRSFSILGHTSELAVAVQWLLSLHVILIAWWLGALWPLRQACYQFGVADLQKLMHRFGRYASYAVAILALCGGIVTYQVFGSFTSIFTTNYGQTLMVKLGLVVGVLAFAAHHKLRLVPRLLTREQGPKVLARSIEWEMKIALVILIVTTWLTTMVGPSH